MRASYSFLDDGLDRSGVRLPHVPIIWLGLEATTKRFLGPCLVDTGFDGALYASADMALLLEDVTVLRKDYLYTVGDREIECEVFSLRAYLTAPESHRKLLNLGAIEALVPTRPDELSDVTIVGRKVLNSLVIRLDGKKLEVL